MKVKALLVAAAALVATSAFADGYNRAGVSYNNTHFGYNKEAGGKDDSFSTNGFGLEYIHGFNLTESTPIFLEVGANVNFDFGSKTWEGETERISGTDYWFRDKETNKKQYINLQVPVNFGYRFNVGENFKISPYVGLNFKFNLVGKYKLKGETESNIPMNVWEAAGYDAEDLEWEGKWQSVFSKDDMGGSDWTWNRFQMGWHVGVGFQYKPFYLGLQYGTDFIPAFKYEKAKINTGNLKVSLGYCF